MSVHAQTLNYRFRFRLVQTEWELEQKGKPEVKGQLIVGFWSEANTNPPDCNQVSGLELKLEYLNFFRKTIGPKTGFLVPSNRYNIYGTYNIIFLLLLNYINRYLIYFLSRSAFIKVK
jgi:hypothetical protein